MDLCQEKGASIVLPIEEYGFTFHKTAFRDALALRWFPSIRHNEIRVYTAYLLSEICHNVSAEPHLQPITGEVPTSASANSQDGARLDVFNPYAPSNRQPQLSACYRSHEASKKRAYERRILEFEHAFFSPLIFSATGDLGREAQWVTNTLLPSSQQNGATHSSTMAWI
ncbi:hypothetical protein EMCRGX_G017694 [Ephydatia muelleri]